MQRRLRHSDSPLSQHGAYANPVRYIASPYACEARSCRVPPVMPLGTGWENGCPTCRQLCGTDDERALQMWIAVASAGLGAIRGASTDTPAVSNSTMWAQSYGLIDGLEPDCERGETEALGGVDMREARDLAEICYLDGGSSERDDWRATITREEVGRRLRHNC